MSPEMQALLDSLTVERFTRWQPETPPPAPTITPAGRRWLITREAYDHDPKRPTRRTTRRTA